MYVVRHIDLVLFSYFFSYKNGSLTRERICGEDAEGSWELFNQLLDSTPRGNFGNIGTYELGGRKRHFRHQ